MKELKSIFPPKTKVVFGDDVIEIKSITFKDLPLVAEIAEKVFDKIFGLLLSDKDPDTLGIEISKEIINILKYDTDSLKSLISITTSVQDEVIPDISIEASLFLLDNILEVNKDFLSQKVLPMAKQIFSKYKPKENLETNGLPQSKN